MGWWILIGVVAVVVILAIPLGRRGGRRGKDGGSRDSVVESRRDTRAWRRLGGMRSDDSWRDDKRSGR